MDLQQRILKGFEDFREKYKTEPTLLTVNNTDYAEIQKTADNQSLKADPFKTPPSMTGCNVAISELAINPILSKIHGSGVKYLFGTNPRQIPEDMYLIIY